MKAELVAFGELKIEGERYVRDVVIEGGEHKRWVRPARTTVLVGALPSGERRPIDAAQNATRGLAR